MPEQTQGTMSEVSLAWFEVDQVIQRLEAYQERTAHMDDDLARALLHLDEAQRCLDRAGRAQVRRA